jgi:hypothetical protein
VNVGPCRVPLPQYTQTRMEALHESLKLIGFFDWKDGQDD